MYILIYSKAKQFNAHYLLRNLRILIVISKLIFPNLICVVSLQIRVYDTSAAVFEASVDLCARNKLALEEKSDYILTRSKADIPIDSSM